MSPSVQSNARSGGDLHGPGPSTFRRRGLKATTRCDINLRQIPWELALDQRAFGPRRLLVAFTDVDGRLLSIGHTERSDPPAAALAACIEHLGGSAIAAVAYCDEPVAMGPLPPELAEHWATVQTIAGDYAVHLIDWIACDDQLFRSTRLALHPDEE